MAKRSYRDLFGISGPGIDATVVAHQSSCSRPIRATTAHHEVGKMKKSSLGFGGKVARWRRDGGGASAQDGDGTGAMRTMRRTGVGTFIGGRVTFYRAEARRGRAGVPSWPALKPRLEGTGYQSEEGEGV
jgi:hypothetical protein